ncbi:putative protein kinase [Trypanosoma grayi]|uniref:putative protein kinase n=1 Tax=Trypanosoma grayi TaxID=71804 RepID=UPI0004F484EA|nr:putative protein kinase [Trypanosoma grayi]KEG11142.1 putative protein kinase [Trypanosoma grayi]
MPHSPCEGHGGFEFDLCKLKLGTGGSGTVFLAQHRHTRELVAVKRVFAKKTAASAATPLRHSRRSLLFTGHSATRAARGVALTPDSAGDAISQQRGTGCRGTGNNEEEEEEEEADEGVEEEDEEEGDMEEKDEEEENMTGGTSYPTSAEQQQSSRTAHMPCESTILQYLGPHPHIVRFLGSCTTSCRVTFFAMELMDSDLGRELRAANTAFMSEDVARPLLYAVVAAIAHLHKRGIAHRDIKPSNILLKRADAEGVECGGSNSRVGVVSKEERIKAALGDFSAAHFMHESAKVGNARGTLYYKAPEQFIGRAENYFACDMWALGCTMFEFSTGSIAFCGSTDLQVLHQIHAKLGTDFRSYPHKTHEATLFDSLCVPSPLFLDLLKGFLALDPRERLTANEALSHAFFDPLRHKQGAYNDGVEETFPVRLRCCRAVDPAQLTFRSVIKTPTKRSRVQVVGSTSHTKHTANHLDGSLSCSCQHCSMWSSFISASPSPSVYSNRMRSQQESVDASRRRSLQSGGPDTSKAARRLSISSCALGAGSVSAQGRDENSRAIGQFISPVALRFSPATSVKRPSGPAVPPTQCRVPRLTPLSNVTLGNARTNMLFERAMAGGGCAQGGARVLFEDDAYSLRYDADSPSVRKMLFESPQRTLSSCLNESHEKVDESVSVDGPEASMRRCSEVYNSPQLLLKTPEPCPPPFELLRNVPAQHSAPLRHINTGRPPRFDDIDRIPRAPARNEEALTMRSAQLTEGNTPLSTKPILKKAPPFPPLHMGI